MNHVLIILKKLLSSFKRWNRELNPAVVGIVCLVVSLLVLDQSLRLVFRPVGGASAEAVVLAKNVLADLPTDNLHQRLSAIKVRINDLETEKDTLIRELPTLTNTSRTKNIQRVNQINGVLEILREEETKTIDDIASNPNQ